MSNCSSMVKQFNVWHWQRNQTLPHSYHQFRELDSFISLHTVYRVFGLSFSGWWSVLSSLIYKTLITTRNCTVSALWNFDWVWPELRYIQSCFIITAYYTRLSISWYHSVNKNIKCKTSNEQITWQIFFRGISSCPTKAFVDIIPIYCNYN